ncbi:hypothetical protein VNO78_22045 [Psophocarpus tetragonolobus]|uniref:Uncharacterized protein n=1 Tax=Psophocarpus tetragonolobus TaxID=3891 RepID=A0AAN9XIU1_PSOTE
MHKLCEKCLCAGLTGHQRGSSSVFQGGKLKREDKGNEESDGVGKRKRWVGTLNFALANGNRVEKAQKTRQLAPDTEAESIAHGGYAAEQKSGSEFVIKQQHIMISI